MNAFRCTRLSSILLFLLAAGSMFSSPKAVWAATAHDLYVVPPCRIYDSRVPGASPQGPLLSGVVYSFNLPEGTCGLPSDVVSLVLNITAVTTDPPPGATPRTGYISVFPGGTAPPGFGVGFREGQNRALFLITKLGTSPSPDLGFQGVTTLPSFHLAIDVTGYTGSGEPSDIALDSTSVPENQPAGTLVGNLSTTDSDVGDTHTYTLVGGVGNTDNPKFQITGHQLLTSAVLDHEAQPTYSIRLRSTDIFGGFVEKIFTVSATNQNEAPTGLSLSSTEVEEGQPAGTLIGTFSTTDPDAADSHSYTLVAGPLGPDNDFFQISGSQLLSNAVFDREARGTYTISVQTADQGTLTFMRQLTITVNDVNEAPAPSGGPFTVAENSSAGTTVGTVSHNDPDLGESYTFSITAGNAGGAFAVHAATGEITVATPAVLDFETTPTFGLTVQVTDSGSPSVSGSTTVVIHLTNQNEAPVVSGGPFSVAENSVAGTVVGTMSASDPDVGQSRTFNIAAGNTGGAFVINASTGEITVATPGALDFETALTFNLTVQVADDGSPSLSHSTAVTISITNVNEAPVPSGGPFSVAENSAAGTVVGTVSATDPDAGQTRTFAITSGNTGGAFAIHPASGVMTVATPSALNFEAVPIFNLTVQATDNGSPGQSGSTTVTINVSDVNEAPVPSGGTFTVAENSSAGTAVGTVSASDPDTGQTRTFAILSGNTGGAFAINPATGSITVATPSAVDFETAPTFNLTVQVTDNGSPSLSGSTTVVVNVTNVNDAPVASGGPFGIPENSGNNTLVGTVGFTDQDAGQTHTFQITAGNTGGAFWIGATGVIRVANGSALNFEASPIFNLTVRVTDNGSPSMSGSATVTINLSNVPEAPAANDEGSSGSPYVDTVGNTLLEVTTTPSMPHPKILFAGNFLTNDSDPDGPTAFTVTLEASTSGAVVSLNNDGTFTYVPPAGFTGVDSFTYRITDPTGLFDTATVYINVEGRVWYVKNNAAPGGLGRSTDPFDLLAEAETASTTNDTLFVFAGDGTTLGQSDGITLRSGQRLIGEGVSLVMPSANINGVVAPTLYAAGSRPRIENDNAPDAAGEDNGVNVPATLGNATNVEIRGLDISGFDNAVDVTTAGSKSASVTIRDNVISGSGAEGIDVNGASSGQLSLAIHDNVLTAAGNAIDLQRTAGTAYLTAFDDNVVTGSTSGTGIRINGAVFDANPGGSFDTVSGGVTVIGSLGDGVGQSGLVLTNVEGDLSFASLSIFAAGGAGLSASSFTAYTGSSGLRIAATGGTGVVRAAGGPAVDLSQAYLNIDLASLESTDSPSTGVSLSGVLGSFAAGSGSSISNIASLSGTAFLVENSNAVISYSGTIATNGGTGVSLTSNTGSTVSFSGALTLSTGTNPAFTATGGGTVTATAPGSTLTTTTATALNVVGTTIGASGLTFRSISSTGSGSSAVVLNGTGTSGGLTISGAGGTCTSAATCSGGAIQNKTGDAISLIDTQSVTLSNLFLGNLGGNGIALAPTGATASGLRVTGGVFQNIGGSALVASGEGSGRRTVQVSGATFRDNSRGVYLLGSLDADLTFEVTQNAFLRHVLSPIQVVTAPSSTNAMQVVGRIDQNVIGDGSQDSGSRDLQGIVADLGGDADATLSVTNNLVSNTESEGIFVQARLDDDGDAELGRLDLTLRGNDVNTPDGVGSRGIRVESRNTTALCLDVAGNSSASTGGLEQLQTRQLDTSTFLLERLSDGDPTPGGLITDMPTVEAFLIEQNDAGSTADATQETAETGYTEAADGSCRKPAL